MRKLNKPLLRRLARKLRRLRHEEHYRQDEVIERTSCGTVACIAGHTVILAGYRPTFTNGHWSGLNDPHGKPVVSVLDTAAKLLSLSRGGHWLFDSNPTFAWPKPYADRWRNREDTGERPSRIAADLLDAIADGKVAL